MARVLKPRVLLFLMAILLVLPVAQSLVVAQVHSQPHLVVNTYRLNVRSGPSATHSIITTVAGGTELPVTMIARDGVWYQVETEAGTGWVNTTYAIQRGNFSDIPREPIPGLPTNIIGGTDIAQGAAHVVVNTAFLNIRTGPGVGHGILGVAKGGTELAVTGIDHAGGWYQVETAAGTGWLNPSYTITRGSYAGVERIGAPTPMPKEPPVPAGTAHLVVNTAFLNVRTGPGVGNSVLKVVPGGSELAVKSIARDGVWYEVETSAGVGWVNSTYGVTRGSFANVARAPIPGLPTNLGSGTDIPGGAPHVIVNTAFLNIRSGPSASHSKVSVVKGGTTMLVLGVSPDQKWFLVEGSFGEGWLRNSYAIFRGVYSQVPVIS